MNVDTFWPRSCWDRPGLVSLALLTACGSFLVVLSLVGERWIHALLFLGYTGKIVCFYESHLFVVLSHRSDRMLTTRHIA